MNNHIEEAKNIQNYLESHNKIKKYETEYFKRLFDTVLNSKSQDENEQKK